MSGFRGNPPDTPVAITRCGTRTVRSVRPARRSVTVQSFAVSSNVAVSRSVDVQTLSSMNLA